jgi:hypothetical protein
MKKLYRPLIFISLFGLFFLQSCIEEGTDPFGDPVEKFLGNWRAEETSTVFGPGFVYPVTISRNPSNSAEILISNFYYQGNDIKARALVVGNSLTIMRQKICDDTIEIQGTGTFSDGRVNLNYTANTGADLDNVTAIYKRPE